MIGTTHSKGRRLIGLLAATTVLTPLGFAGSALAQTAEAPETALGEIVVTATRRSESVQKVPIAIQALSGDTLAERQVKGLSDLVTLLPSVSFAGLGPGRQVTFFRGIVPAGGQYGSVGMYLDEIPITGTGITANGAGIPDIHVYDMERIEALSGPQGTLYGAGSLGGTVRFITNKPKIGLFEGGYNVEANKYGKGDIGGQLETFVNLPVNDRMAVRAMAYYRREGGYVDNVDNNGRFADGRPSVLNLGDNNPATSFTLDNSAIAKDDYNTVKEYGGRLALLWEVAEGWSVMPQITAQRQVSNGYFGFDPRVGDLEVVDFDKTRQDDKFYQAALTINGHIGDWDVVSATGYHQRKTKTLNDYTYYTVAYDGFGPGYENYLQFFDKAGCTGTGAALRCTTLINPTQFYSAESRRPKFTQEFRITTPDSWPFDITAGAFYQWMKQGNDNDYAVHGLSNIAGFTQSGGGDSNPAGFGIPTTSGGTMVLGSPAVRRDAYYVIETDQIWKDKALFAEGHYNITPTLKLTAGIRYFWTEYVADGFVGIAATARNTVTSYDRGTGTAGCSVPLPAERLQCVNTNFAVADRKGRYDEKGETHKIALDWQITPSKMVYANYSTGFRPGGFNRPLRIRNVGVASVDPYLSETLTNYELGFKTTWNGIFRLNASAYIQDWDDVQYTVVVAGTQGALMTGNAGRARVKGFEFDADLKLDKFTLSTTGAYNDAKLAENFCNFAFNPASMEIAQLASCTPGQFVPGTQPPTSQVAAEAGTRLPRQPKFKGTSSVRYDTEFRDYGAYIQGAALYQTGATQDLNVRNNALLGNTKGFVTFDFSAGVSRDNWTFDVFLQNAFDKRGILTRNTFCAIAICSDSSRAFPIKPQFFGARFGQRF
ncbi:TonB-dependent receptor [Phenylobacterium sp.]|jgi:iron complex outermembrane receptor protein|uniref:TonB-dependent receptor n=1 Tax=Phenylobacterium sp. TaxID=1871053 RepID=UPI00378338AA